MKLRPILFSAALAMAAASAAAASPAAAVNHIAGATYNGTESAGGTPISFTVTPDGSGIASFSVPGPLQGSTCTFSNIQANYTTPLPIVNDAFTSSSSILGLTGSFPGPQSAQGTLRSKSSFPMSCDTGMVPWTATTTAPPNASATQKKKCKKGQKKVKVNGKVKCKKKKK